MTLLGRFIPAPDVHLMKSGPLINSPTGNNNLSVP